MHGFPRSLDALTMVSDPELPESGSRGEITRQVRSDRLLTALSPFRRLVLVSHVNPDPDSLASMLGLKALLEACQPGKPVAMTVDGMIARAENRAMVEMIPIPLIPVETATADADTAVIMVDSQPYTGRRCNEKLTPQVVIDHHETGGDLNGVIFQDIRDHLGATSTMVTGYLIEQKVLVSPELATALLYGIESETTGYPREASTLDDGALVWLFPRANKDLLARIRNPKLPQSHFATFQNALINAFLYRDLIVGWCGEVSQPDIIAEIADFFIRFDQVNWALAIGLFEGGIKLSLRAAGLGGRAGEVLRQVINGLGNAGGHDKRAGGMIVLPDHDPATVDSMLRLVRHRLLDQLHIDEHQGRRLLQGGSVIQAP